MKGFLLIAVFLLWAPITFAEGPNVILITLDGVRWSEVFEGTDPDLTGAPRVPIMNHLTGELALEGMLLGDQQTSWGGCCQPGQHEPARIPEYLCGIPHEVLHQLLPNHSA